MAFQAQRAQHEHSHMAGVQFVMLSQSCCKSVMLWWINEVRGAKRVVLLHMENLCFELLWRLLVSMHVCTEQQQQQHWKRMAEAE